MANITPTTTAGMANSYESKVEKVTDPARIAGLLLRLKENRSLLRITLPGSTESFNSAILDVTPEQHYLIIDELNPVNGHQLLLEAGRLNASAQLRGVDMRFDSALESAGESKGVAFYRIALPLTLDYLQQRAHYRAKVSMAKAIEISIVRTNGETYSGYLNDISIGGIGIRFNDAQLPKMARGERIPQCHINLPTGVDIHCRIEIRFTSVSVDSSHRMIGGRFIHLNASQEAAIAQYVAALDRELAKKLHKE